MAELEYVKERGELTANSKFEFYYQIIGRPVHWFIDTPNYEIATGTIAVRIFVNIPETNQMIYGSNFFYINNNGVVEFPDLPKRRYKVTVQVFSLVSTTPCWGVLVYEQ